MHTSAKPILQPSSRRPLVDLQATSLEIKKPLISRYAQGHYNPGKERKHSVEQGLNEFEASRGSKRSKTTLAVATVVPASNKNIVGAAKSSLKEKQLIKEKRLRKTGTALPKSRQSLSSLVPRPSVDRNFKAPMAIRQDSFYSQSRDSIRIDEIAELDSSQDLENRVRVVPTASAPIKTIHVARASSKIRSSLTVSNNGSITGTSVADPKVFHTRSVDSESKKVKSVTSAKSFSKSTRESLTKVSVTAPASVLKTNFEKQTTSTTILLKEHALSAKAAKFNGHDVTNLFLSGTSAVRKRNYTRQRAKLAINQDPILVKEYDIEIYMYWRDMEMLLLPDPHYMFKQPDLDWDMRRTLISWVIQVHGQFRLLPETLYLTVNLIDRTLSLKSISLSKLQLVGVAALLIASKYEEILSPSVQDLVYMTDYAYNSEEILSAERYLLGIVSYQLGYPNPLNYLKRLGSESDARINFLSCYFLEVMLLDKQFIQYPSSLLGASAFFLALKTIHSAPWTSHFVALIGYEESSLLPCVYGLLEFLKTDQYEPVFEKYAADSFLGVSKAMRAFLHSKRLA